MTDNLIKIKREAIPTIHTLDKLESLLSKSEQLPGVWRVPDTVYHSSSPISRSGLVKYIDSPANFLIPTPDSPDFVFGRAFHDLLLEGKEKYDRTYITQPPDIKIRKGHKWDAFLEANEGKYILSKKVEDAVRTMVDQARFDNDIRPFFEDPSMEAEVSVFYKEDLWRKVKIDLWIPDVCLMEFKTTSAPNANEFINSFFRYGYDIQAAFYLDTFQIAMTASSSHELDFYVVAVEKNPPYKIYKFLLDDDVLEIGRARYYKLWEMHKQCTVENHWPHSLCGFRDIRVPDWVANKYL